MDILKDIVFPQSPTHLMLLKYLFFLTMVLLLPYLSVLIGSTLFSLMHFSKGKKYNDKKALIFAKELIDIFTINKSMTIALGIVPMLSLTFVFAQLLYGTQLNFTPDFVFSLLLFIAALFNLYIYKYSFALKNIFSLVNSVDIKDKELVGEFENFRNSNSKLLSYSGWAALLLFLIVSYILIGIIKIANTQILESSIIKIIFSTDTILFFLFYVSFSLAITCAAVTFKYFKNDAEQRSKDYLDYIKMFILKTGIIYTFLMPLLFVVSLINEPVHSLSFPVFIVSAIIMLLMLMISILFYLMYKESKVNLGGTAVFVFLILSSLLIYKDQMAFETKNVKNVFEQEKAYKLFAAKIKEDAGITEVVEIRGEDIFNAKCIACHRFDSQLVGPAYNEVLPKYDGKRAELINFIMNPRKINPKLPAMPNQGLKPKEAEAIADYIVKVYQENKK